MSLSIQFFNTGYCTSIEKFAIKTAPWRCCKFPALFALIKHPVHGNVLFDTGHSNRFFALTNQFPMNIYRWLIHVDHKVEDDAKSQLSAKGVNADDINYIIISHFHADHIGSLRDFPNAKFIYMQSAYDDVKNLGYFSSLKAGFLRGLLPDDFEQRSIYLENQIRRDLAGEYSPFKDGVDIFNDGSLFAIDLPGHANGHIGLLMTAAQNQKYFLIADACWNSEAYTSLILPHNIAFIAMKGKKQYAHTLNNIHLLSKLAPEIKIIPSHCQNTWDDISK